jgi:hypothetical protein
MTTDTMQRPSPLHTLCLTLLLITWPGLPAQAQDAAAAPAAPACGLATDKANALDMRAASAQAQRAEAAQVATLVDEAIVHWQVAVDSCEGRARDRAKRNLADSQRMRSAITEVQGAGAQCESTQKDAGALQDLARQAVSERRWQDGSLLFHKAEGLWELAAERCTGALQQAAHKRREQAEIDGHNAEFCAPSFDRAREFTQKFRNTSAAMAPAERQQQSQVAETQWRDLLKACQGSALDIARANADGLLRERGTPWVANRPVVAPVASAAPLPAGGKGQAAAPAALVATAAASPGNAAPAVDTLRGTATPATATAAATPRMVDVLLDGQARLKGLFSLDAGGRTYSGKGRIEWPNGDVYEGDVAQGLRHGRGEFTWPSGQTYQGDWLQDQPTGQGSMRFANGNLYEGQIENGLPQGQGAMVYATGDIFKGRFAAGLPDGEGTYTWTNGQRCACQWVKGEATGRGQLRFANGNAYTGPLKHGLPQGEGEMQFASGDRYSGQFVEGNLDGKGTYTWQNGDSYVGQWKGGLKEGRGIMAWRGGDRWEGVYQADAQTEQGELIRKKR